MARVRDACLQHAVVCQQEQPLTIGIEAARRVYAWHVDVIGKCGSARFRAKFADHPEGLVEGDQHARSRSGEKPVDQIRRYGRHGHANRATSASTFTFTMAVRTWTTTVRSWLLEPLTHISIDPYAVHIVVNGLAQAAPQEVVVSAYGIMEVDIIVCKHDVLGRPQCDTVLFRVQADWRV